jgi:hypothetical protein
MEDENSEVNILKEKDHILNFKNKVHAHETLHQNKLSSSSNTSKSEYQKLTISSHSNSSQPLQPPTDASSL